MDFDSLKRCWREEAGMVPPRLEEGSVIEMIEARAGELRRDVRARLRREASYYLPMSVVPVAGLISGGLTLNRVLAASSIVLLLGGMMVTLWLAERRIEQAPLDRSLRETLNRLVSQLDAAGRAYLAAYVLVFVVAAVTLAGGVWWRQGAGASLAGIVVASVLAILWSIRSGRAYVERMFRRYRAGLADCLGQLDE